MMFTQKWSFLLFLTLYSTRESSVKANIIFKPISMRSSANCKSSGEVKMFQPVAGKLFQAYKIKVVLSTRANKRDF